MKFFIKKLITLIITLLVISFLTFTAFSVIPGDAALSRLGKDATEEQLERARDEMGLNDPLLERYGRWVTDAMQGDFGESYRYEGTSVRSLLAQRLPVTVLLAVISLLIITVISVPLGILSAVRQDGIADYIVRFLSFLGISLPGFLIGLILLYVFALKLGLVKVASSSVGMEQMLLPGITLAIAMASKYSRQVRTAVLEELHQDYVTGARARGMNQWEILFRQVLPNAMLPLVTMLGLSFGSLLGGTSVVEIIFSYPGLGILAVGAVKARDYPLIQGFVLWIALIYMVVNLLVDISYHYIDPRIREGEDG